MVGQQGDAPAFPTSATARPERAGAHRTQAGFALVIGGGPAGLMAAEELALAGHRTVLAEAKPTLARKMLMAGKSGLNLTKDEPEDRFRASFQDGAALSGGILHAALRDFGPAEVMAFARGLGVTLFTGSTGRVFPEEMKASPMLRAWILRLESLGVEIRTRWRWQGFAPQDPQGAAQDGIAPASPDPGAPPPGLVFETPAGRAELHPDVTVLALGGASWPRLGSDAAWLPWLAARGVTLTPFRPANMGLRVVWSEHMAAHFGAPVKGCALTTPDQTSRGEFVVSAEGVEGGGVYALSAAVRDGAPLALDLAPDLDVETLAHRLARPAGGASLSNRLRKAARLDGVRLALLHEWGRPLPTDPLALARRLKALAVPHRGPGPLAGAISSAGGVSAGALDPGLQLRALPGMFCAGEMLDWEAPTGGYLLSGCLASGRLAGRAAARLAGMRQGG